MTCIFILPEGNNRRGDTEVNYFVNGYRIQIDICHIFSHVRWKHTTLFHTRKMNELSNGEFRYNMEKGLLKNEWIHVEFKLDSYYWNLDVSEEEKNKILRRAQMGIHVWKEKSNTEEENVVFTDPYIR
jgi:hypothetical protein